jgi:hypothetical protein
VTTDTHRVATSSPTPDNPIVSDSHPGLDQSPSIRSPYGTETGWQAPASSNNLLPLSSEPSHDLSTPEFDIAHHPPRRSNRFRKQSVKLDDYILSVSPENFDICLTEDAPPLPGDNLTFKEASQYPGWVQAMKDEITSIQENCTWDLVPLPPGKQAITAKWVYKTKTALPGQKPRLKARLVARGFQQRHGIDFDEIFAPVVKWSTIRALTARASQLGHQIHHLDVKTAFLYGHLPDEVYMAQPQGFIEPGSEHLVCKLKKALYGLRQSP